MSAARQSSSHPDFSCHLRPRHRRGSSTALEIAFAGAADFNGSADETRTCARPAELTMLEPGEDLRRRRPVWEALSDLFLDTQLQEHDFRYIARVVAESGYTDHEV